MPGRERRAVAAGGDPALLPIQRKSPVSTSPLKIARRQRVGDAIEDVGDLRAPGDGARERDGEAAQDEQRRQRDDEGGQPRLAPRSARSGSRRSRPRRRPRGCRPRAESRGRVTVSPITTPAKPIIEPTDRSNSPAMISSAAAVAMMPSSAESVRNVIDALQRVERAGAGQEREDQQGRDQAAGSAGLRAAQQPRQPVPSGQGARPPLRRASCSCGMASRLGHRPPRRRAKGTLRAGRACARARVVGTQRMPCLASVRIASAFAGVSTKSGPV